MTQLDQTARQSGNSVAQQLFEAMQNRDALQLEITALGSTLTDPNDDRLVQLDAEIEKVGSLIRRLERMQAGERSRLSEAQRAQHRDALQAAYDKALNLAESRIDLAIKIDKHIEALGGLLAKWAEVGSECRSCAADVHREHAHAHGYSSVLLDCASGFTSVFEGAMQGVLFRAGVGNVGVPLSDVRVPRPLGEPIDMQYAARHAVTIIRTRLREDLAKSLQEIEQ